MPALECLVSLHLAILQLAGVLCWPGAASVEPSPTEIVAQEGAPAPRVAAGPVEETDDVLLAADGKPAARGRVPEATPEGARQLWERMVAAVGQPGRDAAQPKPRALDLQFSAKFRRPGEGTQESKVRLRYLEVGPGLVSGALIDDDGSVRSVQMRGLGDGDKLTYWARKDKGDSVTDGWIKLAGRDFKEDREEIGLYASISYDFARMIEPESCRIVGLQTRAVAPATDLQSGWLQFEGDAGIQLPPNDLQGRREGRSKTLRALASELVWLELATPDFRLVQEDLSRREREAMAKQVKRVIFGLDRKTNLPQLVVVAPTASAALQVPGTTLVQTTEWFDLSDAAPKARFPGRFLIYETARDPGSRRGLGFDPTARADLFTLDGCAIDAPLAPKDFAPEN